VEEGTDTYREIKKGGGSAPFFLCAIRPAVQLILEKTILALNDKTASNIKNKKDKKAGHCLQIH